MVQNGICKINRTWNYKGKTTCHSSPTRCTCWTVLAFCRTKRAIGSTIESTNLRNCCNL
ncbi:hypothetical protein GLOIN_2v1527749 [Rhizophagus irregularis DAOM 181602=DAOM 197198]|uniref:Uncharacterized protein n=1 Tax=Rhizophagus irregularis (strain DAOM 181602 / DAOM 197198 / MUCL 43194) TaxID=747089 RepID=A0A2P4QP85_RHIID|nr:hypothetical protein GLOIN_2v1527749 [Rhizophagus irregularis DAOM 181602=DAOM 197198]POG79434.1 hypothetical protein GLOIN_2v1527749 [Rhizophagus irregularis DAOM 181602=DAOM 197198]|eukprot:XP_025186300.1 hypothetical protein GLOIN_2v1527749 [Rhizophagus irregularis DAOM 181602=DAOM 197198]